MPDEPSLADAVYALAANVYDVVAAFPQSERGILGAQLCSTALDLATQTLDTVTTDDPAERQEVMRQATISCIRLELLLRLANDRKLIRADHSSDLSRDVQCVTEGVARERRSVRR